MFGACPYPLLVRGGLGTVTGTVLSPHGTQLPCPPEDIQSASNLGDKVELN